MDRREHPMAILSHEARLLYIPVPKHACTSAKMMFWRLAHPEEEARDPLSRVRRRLRRATTPQRPIQHRPGYQTLSFARVTPPPEGYDKVVIIRDPLARLVSAWSNKVREGVIARGPGPLLDLANECVPSNPTFSEFIRHFDAYRRVSRAARNHTEPLAWHIGPSLAWYDHVFPMERMDDFTAYVSERAGQTVSMGRKNAGGAESRSAALGDGDEERLSEILAPDYALLEGRYDIETALAKHRKKHPA